MGAQLAAAHTAMAEEAVVDMYFTVNVRATDGATYPCEVNGAKTVADIKKRVNELASIPLELQRLIYHGADTRGGWLQLLHSLLLHSNRGRGHTLTVAQPRFRKGRFRSICAKHVQFAQPRPRRLCAAALRASAHKCITWLFVL